MRLLWGLILLILLSACSATGTDRFSAFAEIAPMVWPAAPERARIEFVKLFNGADDLGFEKSFFSKLKDWFAGAEDRRMTRPYSIAVNDENMVIADPQAAAVHWFDLKRESYRKLDRSGQKYFAAPIAVALGSDRLFIADSTLNKVFILDQNLELINVLDDIQRPTGLAFDPERQQLYVTDTLAHHIRVYDQNGQFQFRIGKRGESDAEFNYPSHLAFKENRLFVNDTMNFRIQIFSAHGRHLKSFGKHGDAIGAFGQSKGVAVDADGHVYVADALASRVQVFDQQGVFLLDFGAFGNRPGYFQLPGGLAFWKDKIYVADSYNGRIQVFRYLGEEG